MSTKTKRDWEKIQEENLVYVAYTRAKHRLGFVNETEVPPAGSDLGGNATANDIAFIEKRVCNIYGREPVKDVSSPELARFRLKTTATKVTVKQPTIKKAEPKKKNMQVNLDELLETLN